MWDDGVVTVAPSAGAEGVMTYTCMRCGETYEEAIPALPGEEELGDNGAEDSGQAENQSYDGGYEEDSTEGYGQEEPAYGDGSPEEDIPDGSGTEEDRPGEDGPEEVVTNGLFQEVSYMPGADMTYTAMWEEEEKEPARIEEDPVAKELTYSGEPQILTDGGTASGGTILYALGDSYDAAPEGEYSEELPEGVEAGDYYVWYYAAGDEEHADSEPACIAYPAVIERREAVVTASDQVVEQGEEPDTSAESAQITGTVPDHMLYDVTLTAGSTAEYGIVSISPSAAVITDAYGTDVTDNYEILYQDGTLTVKGQMLYRGLTKQ
jgi:hypothetical protein